MLGSGIWTGRLRWFSAADGYGSIRPDAGGEDLVIHISAVRKAGISSLAEGTRVSYHIVSLLGKKVARICRLED
jgi:CspA family cold shock protein